MRRKGCHQPARKPSQDPSAGKIHLTASLGSDCPNNLILGPGVASGASGDRPPSPGPRNDPAGHADLQAATNPEGQPGWGLVSPPPLPGCPLGPCRPSHKGQWHSHRLVPHTLLPSCKGDRTPESGMASRDPLALLPQAHNLCPPSAQIPDPHLLPRAVCSTGIRRRHMQQRAPSPPAPWPAAPAPGSPCLPPRQPGTRTALGSLLPCHHMASRHRAPHVCLATCLRPRPLQPDGSFLPPAGPAIPPGPPPYPRSPPSPAFSPKPGCPHPPAPRLCLRALSVRLHPPPAFSPTGPSI